LKRIYIYLPENVLNLLRSKIGERELSGFFRDDLLQRRMLRSNINLCCHCGEKFSRIQKIGDEIKYYCKCGRQIAIFEEKFKE